jgi:DNA-binding transcriptional regulator WhiA
MSFSEQVKEELQALQIKPVCCRKAYLWGLMMGAQAEGEQITFRIPATFAEHATAEIKRHFGRECSSRPYVSGRASGMELSFPSAKSASQIVAWDAGEAADFSAACKCPQCTFAFLRGAFCAIGTVSDPATGSHLEFKCPTISRARGLQTIVAQNDLKMGIVTRGKGVGVYIKNSQGVEDVLTLLGSSTMVFELLNKKIEREIRGLENRMTNCDTGNIGKFVSAARRQIAAIEKLERYGALTGLPDALQDTAMLRLRYPDAALGELAQAHVPPITKSGLNHRLQKLIDLANELPD